MLKRWLSHPLTRNLDLNDPLMTHQRRTIIQQKPFLKAIYHEWYTALAAAIPAGHAPVLELGSGAGFLHDYLPNLITSEIFPCPDIHAVLSGHDLPFATRSLRAIVMTDVLHHIPQPRRFFHEVTRCVRPGGCVAMVEPWVTDWSRFIYTHLHHEPFLPESPTWEFATSGPLSGANGAMPWILFARDRTRFEQEYPALRIQTIQPMMPFRYLVSGGVSLRSLMPGWTTGLWRNVETRLHAAMPRLAMFAFIVIERIDVSNKGETNDDQTRSNTTS